MCSATGAKTPVVLLLYELFSVKPAQTIASFAIAQKGEKRASAILKWAVTLRHRLEWLQALLHKIERLFNHNASQNNLFFWLIIDMYLVYLNANIYI
jgi:hypothetical protein